MALAALAAVLALVAGYARHAVVNSDQFANRATAALEDPAVRALISTRVADQVLAQEPELIAVRPLIESVAGGVVGSGAFTGVFRSAVRDLHRAHPGAYRTAVDTAWPALWENNPLVEPAGPSFRPDRVIDCHYPLVHESNRRPFHFLHGYIQDLERKLGVTIPVGAFRGDVHLAPGETSQPSPVSECGYAGPYWVMMAGGKHDFTAKWWDPASYQVVVDHFAGRVRFVQCGNASDWHPKLRGVIDFVGRTDLRQFMRVLYHADGVVCPVTFAMHLAAALPPRPGGPALRPCVVIAGGREPPHWEQYPGHQFLHTVGALDCCAAGGCWRSRCQPLGDGAAADSDLCTRPVATGDGVQVPRCMTMITPAKVAEAIELYYDGGVLRYASPPTRSDGAPGSTKPAESPNR